MKTKFSDGKSAGTISSFLVCTFSFVQTKEKRTKKKNCRLPLRGGSIAAFPKEKELTAFKQLFLFYAKAPIPLLRPSTKGRKFLISFIQRFSPIKNEQLKTHFYSMNN